MMCVIKQAPFCTRPVARLSAHHPAPPACQGLVAPQGSCHVSSSHCTTPKAKTSAGKRISSWGAHCPSAAHSAQQSQHRTTTVFQHSALTAAHLKPGWRARLASPPGPATCLWAGWKGILHALHMHQIRTVGMSTPAQMPGCTLVPLQSPSSATGLPLPHLGFCAASELLWVGSSSSLLSPKSGESMEDTGEHQLVGGLHEC